MEIERRIVEPEMRFQVYNEAATVPFETEAIIQDENQSKKLLLILGLVVLISVYWAIKMENDRKRRMASEDTL